MNLDFNNAGIFPTSIDLLHILLAVAVFFLVLVIVRIRLSAKPASIDTVASSENIPVVNPVSSAPELVNKAEANITSASPDAALQLLSLLQQEARFVDFAQEDLASFSDAEIGAVARVVHEGSKKALATYFAFEPVSTSEEESTITVAAGFNPAEYRLTGNVVGEAPFTGTLTHRGWQVTHSQLPKIAKGHNTSIIAPAEVEL